MRYRGTPRRAFLAGLANESPFKDLVGQARVLGAQNRRRPLGRVRDHHAGRLPGSDRSISRGSAAIGSAIWRGSAADAFLGNGCGAPADEDQGALVALKGTEHASIFLRGANCVIAVVWLR